MHPRSAAAFILLCRLVGHRPITFGVPPKTSEGKAYTVRRLSGRQRVAELLQCHERQSNGKPGRTSVKNTTGPCSPAAYNRGSLCTVRSFTTLPVLSDAVVVPSYTLSFAVIPETVSIAGVMLAVVVAVVGEST